MSTPVFSQIGVLQVGEVLSGAGVSLRAGSIAEARIEVPIHCLHVLSTLKALLSPACWEDVGMRFKGLYRIKSLHGIPDGVWVSDGTNSYEVPQQFYLEMGMQPPLEQLAWDPEQLKDLPLRPRHKTTE